MIRGLLSAAGEIAFGCLVLAAVFLGSAMALGLWIGFVLRGIGLVTPAP